MRDLRRDAEQLNETVVDDLNVFVHPHDHLTFMRLPSMGPDDANDIGVTVTCTALMTLAVTATIEDLYKTVNRSELRAKLSAIFDKFLGFRWTSSQLPENNAFTTALVLRAAAILCGARYAEAAELNAKQRLRENKDPDGKAITDAGRQYHEKALQEIALMVLKGVPESLAVLKYPPTPAIAYWLCEAIDHLAIRPESADWEKLATWVSSEFTRQLSLIAANHEALMDPVALGMAACLCMRLKKMAARDKHTAFPTLPSETELRYGVRVFLQQQSASGIWEKYFPLFHYPGAGSNHCWAFEVLEAILNEFDGVVEHEDALPVFEKSVQWCGEYRLNWLGQGWRKDDLPFRGWNSGGQQLTLARGEPESWATGVIHMFLRRLRDQLSASIRRSVLVHYHVNVLPRQDEEEWKNKTIDTHIKLLGETNSQSIKEIVEKYMIRPITGSPASRELPKDVKRSALLFGPPGTGKTRFVRAVARVIGWDFVEINPTAFLSNGLEGVYVRSKEIFEDMRDLYRAVVFFDEMDAMLQRRVESGKPPLEVEQQFLTTSMLPHLAELYERRNVLFFVATNYGKTFDQAIVRPGRFDMLLFMGPPTWRKKRDHLTAMVDLRDHTKEPDMAWTLGEWVQDDEALGEALDLATIGEMRAMMRLLCEGEPLDVAVASGKLTKNSFRECVLRWRGERFSLLCDDELRKQYREEKDTSEIR